MAACNSIDWSTAQATLVDTGGVFLALLDEMERDRSGFIHNRTVLVEAFRDHQMFYMCVPETDAMFKDKDSRYHPRFMDWKQHADVPFYCLPIVAVIGRKDESVIDILWVHSRCRRAGFGRMIVQQLGIKRAPCVMEDSVPFWNAPSVEVGRVQH